MFGDACLFWERVPKTRPIQTDAHSTRRTPATGCTLRNTTNTHSHTRRSTWNRNSCKHTRVRVLSSRLLFVAAAAAARCVHMIIVRVAFWNMQSLYTLYMWHSSGFPDNPNPSENPPPCGWFNERGVSSRSVVRWLVLNCCLHHHRHHSHRRPWRHQHHQHQSHTLIIAPHHKGGWFVGGGRVCGVCAKLHAQAQIRKVKIVRLSSRAIRTAVNGLVRGIQTGRQAGGQSGRQAPERCRWINRSRECDARHTLDGDRWLVNTPNVRARADKVLTRSPLRRMEAAMVCTRAFEGYIYTHHSSLNSTK